MEINSLNWIHRRRRHRLSTDDRGQPLAFGLAAFAFPLVLFVLLQGSSVEASWTDALDEPSEIVAANSTTLIATAVGNKSGRQ